MVFCCRKHHRFSCAHCVISVYKSNETEVTNCHNYDLNCCYYLDIISPITFGLRSVVIARQGESVLQINIEPSEYELYFQKKAFRFKAKNKRVFLKRMYAIKKWNQLFYTRVFIDHYERHKAIRFYSSVCQPTVVFNRFLLPIW